MVYRFDTEEDREKVLQGGPYFAFGIPILKIMPRCFFFNEDVRHVPARIQIHGLPPDYWSQKGLSMIGSEIGKPLYTDKLTRTRERLVYARLMVEIPVFGQCVHEVPVTLPTGAQVDLRIVYEVVPNFCEVCQKIGHRTAMCRRTAPVGHQPQPVELTYLDDLMSVILVGTGWLWGKILYILLGYGRTGFIAAVQEFFREGRLLKQWNNALISLVPKADHAPGVSDYRPISCCNVFYKVIAKVLACRLSKVMGYLVDEAQATFVQGRSIGDNINLTQELLRKYVGKRILPRCMIKVDLKKAFDMVNWDFLMTALVGYSFPQ